MDRARFIALWQRTHDMAACCRGEEAFEQLDRRYNECCRHYHDGEHIKQMLEWFDPYRGEAQDPDAVELAIWFHDACYGNEPQGHESRSAALFRSLSGEGMPTRRQQRVVDLIMATTHQGPPGTDDEALVVDVDLSSFARSWHAFLKDTVRCRAEKQDVGDQEFCTCQLGFLRTLRARESIYYSAPFQARHEADARANIDHLIHLLELRQRRLSASANG
ncbi:hypothetical protein [Motiliproteus sp. SC1-56]|uniref:HD domain-containing protein n=1 Tax=Motiliproteus sp. SC1-56 TaxID=2799565 RepID=UPI001A8C7D13|nr:hypothetical protein [Motiliproteus sp. SC1-56]